MKIETKRAPAPVRIVPKRVSTQQTHANGNGPVMSTNVIPVTKQSIKTWTERVKKLLEGRPHGLMKSQVEKFYEKQWDEKLPYHWSDVMLEDEIIVMKRESNQSNYIVALKSLSTQTVQAVDNSVAIPSGGYPTSSNWTVTITNVVSTGDNLIFILILFPDQNCIHSSPVGHVWRCTSEAGGSPESHGDEAQSRSSILRRPNAPGQLFQCKAELWRIRQGQGFQGG